MKTIVLVVLGLLGPLMGLPGSCDDATQDPDEGIQMDVPPVGGFWNSRGESWRFDESYFEGSWESRIETTVEYDPSALMGLRQFALLVECTGPMPAGASSHAEIEKAARRRRGSACCLAMAMGRLTCGWYTTRWVKERRGGYPIHRSSNCASVSVP